MQIDEARQNVHARGIDFMRRGFWRVGRAHVACDVFRFDDGRNPITFNNDVHRTTCRSTGTIDESRIANHEPLKRAFTFGAWRGG